MRYNTEETNNIPIRTVCERLGIETKKKGTAYWAQCLWHSPDEHPSMQVGGKYNVVKCYSCGESHDVVGVIMKFKNCSFLDACQWIETYMPEYNIRNEESRNVGTKEQRNARNIARINKQMRKTATQTLPASYSDTTLMPAFPVEPHLGDPYNSSFARCLKGVFDDEIMKRVVDTYQLGNWEGNVLFPSIDINDVIRDMKLQAYNADFHSDKKATRWIGPILFPNAEFDRNCLFGEHLLKRWPDRIVALVESPKNACVGYAQYPDYVWVAAGNKCQLKREILNVLQNRKTFVLPDEDAYEEWQEKLNAMRDIATFQLIHTPGSEPKRDIADWIIKRCIASSD